MLARAAAPGQAPSGSGPRRSGRTAAIGVRENADMLRRRVAPLLLVGALVVLGACSGSDDETADPTTPTTATGSQPAATTEVLPTSPEPDLGDDACPLVMPGAVLDADEAVVHFATDRICPSYVTVDPLTPVTFVNDTDADADVAIHGAYPDLAERGEPLETATIAPGDEWVWTPDAAFVYYFTVSSVPTFVGTVEAGPGGGHVVTDDTTA